MKIKDSGVGIQEEELNKIFNPYYQVKNSLSLNSIGTGIGLSMVSGIIHLHKGNIDAKSILGQGSTFTIKLPFGKNHFTKKQLIPNFKNSEYLGHYLDPNDPPAQLPDNDYYLTQIEKRTKKFKLLIVEDNTDLPLTSLVL